jgi:TolA-binding protein
MSGSSFPRAAVALALALTLAGCAATLGGGGSSLQSDVDALRVSMDRLRQEQAQDRARMDALEQEAPEPETEVGMAEMRDRVDIMEAQVYALARRLEGSDEQMGGLSYEIQRIRYQLDELDRLARSLAPPSGTLDGEAPGPGEAAGGAAGTVVPGLPGGEPGGAEPAIRPAEDPAGVFQKAYADYTRGDYQLAALGFESVLQLRPEGALADDAVYYLAETSSAQGRIDEALRGYARVEEDYPDGDKVPAAILKRGLLLIDANRIGEGVVQLDHLVKRYPEADEARLARNKLRALGVGP